MRLFKRGDTYYVYVYESGRRVQRSTRCHDKKAAEAVARQIERDAADPDHAAALHATLTSALELLLQARAEKATAGRGSAETVAFYRRKAGHLVRVFETTDDGVYVPFKLSRLHARDVDEYVSRRRSEGASESTISKELVTLRAALKQAVRAGIWTGNPAAILPVGFAPEYRPRKRFLSVAELMALLGQLTSDHAARVAFIISTSANWGESDRALREDVATDLSTVHIRGTKRHSRLRDVPIVSDIAKSLLKYAMAYAEGGGGLLFRPWTNVRRDLHAACDAVGIPHCSPNDLRRTCATWLRAAGAPPELIAPVLGHADNRMVERVYGRLPVEDLRRRLAQAIGADCITGASDQVHQGGFAGPVGQQPLLTGTTLPPTVEPENRRPRETLRSGGAEMFERDVVPGPGIEPGTRGFSVPCSTS